ncbi:MAG: pirin family protein [Candidatus Binataceae bacterium]
MIAIRKADERGNTRFDWLDSRHTFSFGDYHDPAHMGFRTLRVINEDRVRPGLGFPTHSHRDMEIVTYILEGALEHKDSLGNGSVIRPGEVQRMSAGRGITHSEFNSSSNEAVHFLQIWILPEAAGIAPGYEQQRIDLSSARGKFLPIASREGGPGMVKLHQDAAMSVAILEPGDKLVHRVGGDRHAWLQVGRGEIALNGDALKAGDGAAISGEPELKIETLRNAEILLFDLA